MCDVRSTKNAVTHKNYWEKMENGQLKSGHNYGTEPSKEHKWYFYPLQTKDEVLLFNQYDSKDTFDWKVFHGAFEDPNSDKINCPVRESIEVRVGLIYND